MPVKRKPGMGDNPERQIHSFKSPPREIRYQRLYRRNLQACFNHVPLGPMKAQTRLQFDNAAISLALLSRAAVISRTKSHHTTSHVLPRLSALPVSPSLHSCRVSALECIILFPQTLLLLPHPPPPHHHHPRHSRHSPFLFLFSQCLLLSVFFCSLSFPSYFSLSTGIRD